MNQNNPAQSTTQCPIPTDTQDRYYNINRTEDRSCKRINKYNNYGLDPCFCPFLPLLHFTAFEIMNGKVALSALVNTVALFETPYNFWQLKAGADNYEKCKNPAHHLAATLSAAKVSYYPRRHIK